METTAICLCRIVPNHGGGKLDTCAFVYVYASTFLVGASRGRYEVMIGEQDKDKNDKQTAPIDAQARGK